MNKKELRWSFAKDGASIRLPTKGRKAIACCDCGLVHWFSISVTNGRVYLVPTRDDRESAKTRKKFAGKFTHREHL